MDQQPGDTDNALIDEIRRRLLKGMGVAAGMMALSPVLSLSDAFAASGQSSGSSAQYVYVGTYTGPNTAPGGVAPSQARGIYVFRMDSEQGGLTQVQVMAAENPSFLALSPNRRYLYSVNELGPDAAGKPQGQVSAYRIDPSSGELAFINTRPTQGTWTCHCSVHPSGRYLFASNYGTGSFSVFPLGENGEIGEMSDLVESPPNGLGPDGVRQEGAHAHMMITGPGGHHVFGLDLGADRLLAFTLDMDSGRLSPGPVPYANVASGSGCRHMVFHPQKPFAYVLNELSSTVDVFDFYPERGSFIHVQALSTLPADSEFGRPVFNPDNPGEVPGGSNTTAELRIHPQGRFLYATNRGMNSIAMFEVNTQSGHLTNTGWVASGGEIPRGMNLDPAGRFLYVGNQNSDTINVFRIQADNGKLEGPVQTIGSPVPVDFVFNAVNG
ncbi:3-carboxymuconate cyclase [Kushneria pakistanensis]|uniref:3-carboxymuconate cyclase n=1 Tax=Kushneria pakistanensis TaxID=1508770 RepID=A0ABQ3FFN5_9GAMM|nr:lactonase family protein [Kushneria pakistanensis]GHC22100.1 3-carboxymuconate cyclase [Kushneria pakistanensis]